MTKTKKYSKILTKFLKDFAKKHQQSANGLSVMAITDRENHHYQAVTYGFQLEPKKYVFSLLFHLDIIDDKIWFQCNYTDLLIEDKLLELGISKADIIFGWLPKYAREHSGWGVEEKAA